jgi:hypothetical protein
LHIERFSESRPEYPEALLYVADYDGGIRIYRHGALGEDHASEE